MIGNPVYIKKGEAQPEWTVVASPGQDIDFSMILQKNQSGILLIEGNWPKFSYSLIWIEEPKDGGEICTLLWGDSGFIIDKTEFDPEARELRITGLSFGGVISATPLFYYE